MPSQRLSKLEKLSIKKEGEMSLKDNQAKFNLARLIFSNLQLKFCRILAGNRMLADDRIPCYSCCLKTRLCQKLQWQPVWVFERGWFLFHQAVLESVYIKMKKMTLCLKLIFLWYKT